MGEQPVQLFAKIEIICYTFIFTEFQFSGLAARETGFKRFGAEPRGGKNFSFGFAVTH
jgi:hypothetical protein